MNRRRALGLLTLGLGGCAGEGDAPTSQPLRPPRLEADALVAADGTRLPLTIWPAGAGATGSAGPWAVMVALHGMDDYAQAFEVAGPFWAARGVTTYAYDQRGFGRGPERGLWPRRGLFASDLRAACALVRARHPDALLAVVGESMGGAVAIQAFAERPPPEADRLALLSPAVWGWSEQPLTYRLALTVAARLDPAAQLTPPDWVYRSHPASDNIALLRRMGRDPNMIFKTRLDATLGLVELMEIAARRIGEVQTPVLYAYGARDYIIPRHAAEVAAARLRPGARTAFYPQGWHLLDRDLHADAVLSDVLAFVRDPKAPLPSGAPPIPPPGRRRDGEGEAVGRAGAAGGRGLRGA